jgi:dihydroorotase
VRADLLIRGGDVIDPEVGRRIADVAIADGRIAAVAEGLAAEDGRVIDARGRLVTPGLVDLHAHVFHGQDLGVDPDRVGPASGTTTFVDTGSAGGDLFGAFRLGTIERAIPRIRAFLNISSIGVTSMLRAGELENLAYCDVDTCVACAQAHSDLIVGVKVRASGNVVGASGDEPLRRARAAADRLGQPLMVHLGPAPSDTATILAALGAGDVLTHCFTGWEDNRLLVDGRIRPAVLEAQRRGVRFDVGHGMGSFDAEIARTMIAEGFAPDAISSDIHAYSEAAVGDLPAVMSKFLALGLSLEEVVARTTLEPARVLGLDAGTLRVGAPADVAVLEVLDGPVAFEDTWGHAFEGARRLRAVLTVRAGAIVHEEERR